MNWSRKVKSWLGWKPKGPTGSLKPTKVTFLRRFDNKRNENARRVRQIVTGVLGPTSRGV